MNTSIYRYLIYVDGNTAFYTHWFEAEKHYSEGDIVFDIEENKYTINGKDWVNIEEDHL